MRARRLGWIVPAVLAMVFLVGGATRAGGGSLAGCTPSAKSAWRACRAGAASSAWLETGKCQQVASADEREDCTEEAGEALADEREECGEQHEARLEVCDVLGEAPYDPEIVPANFVPAIDNRFLPFVPGTTWTYEGETEDGTETIVLEATSETRVILGVTCTVVRDRAYLDGELIEDTRDWFAQDVLGNVWYFGERSYEIEDGEVVSIEGSWEAGVDGARPGIVMPAAPEVGQVFRQEFLLGEAEDMGEMLSLDAAVTVPYGSFTGCRQTRDFSPLSPGSVEHKFYAAGVGLVLERHPVSGSRVELISMTSAP